MNGNCGNNWDNGRIRCNNDFNRGGKEGYRGRRNEQQQSYGRGNGGRRNGFQKFLDVEYREKEQNWSRNSWNTNNYNNRNRNYNQQKGFRGTSHLYNNEQQKSEAPPTIQNNNNGSEFTRSEPTQTSSALNSNRALSVRKDLTSNKIIDQEPKTCIENTLNQIKQESIKTEKKSDSSSSSSSSDSSSSDEEASKVSKITNISKSKTSPARTQLFKTAAISKKSNKKNSPSSSSSSSSSSEEKEEATIQEPNKSSRKKKKPDEDVVCMGNIENKITLEDDEESNPDGSDIGNIFKRAKSKKKSKKSNKEQCMLCDKKGHTSFQCQMICKNCSAPYHGFRTCPHPANLNTMMHLFMEFCMQQFQHFQSERQLRELLSHSNQSIKTVPQPLVESPTTNSRDKRKRTTSTKNDTDTLSTNKRKRKTKKKSKKRCDDIDSNDTTSESSENSSEDESSSEGFQCLKTSKSKKFKNMDTSTMGSFNIPNFIPSLPINYPITVNGIPNMPPSSNIPLNTLLLSQMFQNSIGSIARNNR
ncbi:uncharacterized protein LOC142226300 [Haematobia irritans]|uniref:uncharacterized protein LOC142226300 n=1 Tax=Haematobia irritans TaxID=7368 RepID=UPI003F5011DE